jgi:hypothetical protein
MKLRQNVSLIAFIMLQTTHLTSCRSRHDSSAVRSKSPLSKVKTFSELPPGDDGWVFQCKEDKQDEQDEQDEQDKQDKQVYQWFRFVRDTKTNTIKVHQVMTEDLKGEDSARQRMAFDRIRKMTDANKPMLVDGAEYFTDSTKKMKYVASLLTDDSEIQRKEFYVEPPGGPVFTQKLILVAGVKNELGLKYELIYNEDKPSYTADCGFIQP